MVRTKRQADPERYLFAIVFCFDFAAGEYWRITGHADQRGLGVELADIKYPFRICLSVFRRAKNFFIACTFTLLHQHALDPPDQWVKPKNGPLFGCRRHESNFWTLRAKARDYIARPLAVQIRPLRDEASACRPSPDVAKRKME